MIGNSKEKKYALANVHGLGNCPEPGAVHQSIRVANGDTCTKEVKTFEGEKLLRSNACLGKYRINWSYARGR